MIENNPPQFVEDSEQTINLRELIDGYLFYWKWFILSIVLAVGIAFLYLRYSQNIYESKATLLIKDDSKGGSMPEMAVFGDLDLFGSSANLSNEIELLSSRTITESIVKELGINKQYIIRGDRTGFQSEELYGTNPFELSHIIHDSLIYNKEANFKLHLLDQNSFEIEEVDSISLGKFNFNDIINSSLGPIKIVKTINFDHSYTQRRFEINVNELSSVADGLMEVLEIEPVNKDAFVLSISTKGNSINQNNDIINELIRQYEIDQLKDQNELTANTRAFIESRMTLISKELSDVDNSNLQFKKKNHLTDVSSDAQLLITKESEIEKQIIETGIQLGLAEHMEAFLLNKSKIEQLLPGNLGFEDQSIARMIDNHNTLVLERNRLLSSSSSANPSIIKLDNQINSLKSSLKSSLKNIVSSYSMELVALKRKANTYNTELATMPEFEKEYRDIQRQQQTKETLYLYLLEKREENEIAVAATVSNSKVIDAAYSDGKPVSPKKKIIYLGAIFLGLIITFGIIYIKDLLDNKVHSQKDLEKFNLPHLANIPLSTENEKLVAISDPRSILSEAFRILRTNVAFLLPEKKEEGNIIYVTSTIAGEGKTFVSLNVAHSLALTGKKVAVIGLDLRAPKLLQYLDLQTNLKGVSNYIIDSELSLNDVTIPIPGTKNLFLIPSGITPPNPSELLLKPRYKELLEELKKEYDYIIGDTAPVSLVTDTLTISNFADATLYVSRANKLDKRMLEFPAKLYAEKKLNNMSVIINAIDLNKGGSYGYGYGYGYGDDFEADKKKKWYQFWKK